MNPAHPRPRLRLHPVGLAALLTLAAPLAAQAQATGPASPPPPAQPPTAAGEAAAAEAGDTQQVTVTGSRIRGIAPIGAPVTSVTRASIEAAGAVSTAQILHEVPQIFNLGVSETSRGQSGGSANITYASGINLRGIGPYATLTLLNGHRVVGQGTVGITVDPSVIPSLALERVDVVADGASAIYGSDAIAGVVNLIMRKEVGAEGLLRYGVADGYNERQVGALWGTRWRSGQATFTLEHTYRSALNGRDRDFFRADLRDQGGGDFRSTQCAPGTVIVGSTRYPIPAGGVTPATADTLVAGNPNRCDNLKVQDLIPQQERNSFAFTASQTVAPGIELFADGFATRREYRFQPGYLESNLTVPASNPFYVRPPSAPPGNSVTVAYSFANDLPVNTASGHSETWQLTLGGDVSLGRDWKLSALATQGDNYDVSRTLGGLNTGAINAALADTNPATALNVFGSGANHPATLAAISNTIAISPGRTRFTNYLVKTDGPVVTLPAGALRAALGYERQEQGTVGGQTGGTLANPVPGEASLSRTVDSVFAELYVPLVGGAMAMPGLRRLDLVAAVRSDRYSDVGKTDNPKFGLSWEPVQGLNVRGSYGTSFRAPGLTQVRPFTNGGRGGLYVQNYSDPTLGGAPRVGVTMNGANPDLKPETATTRTLGFDWQLGERRDTRLSLTWFDITYDNQIVGYLSDLSILNREAAFAGTGVIVRDPTPELVAQLIATYPLVRGVLPATWTLYVDGRSKNLAKSKSRGLDFDIRTRLSHERWGDLLLGLQGTRFTRHDVAATANSPLVDQLNTIYNPIKLWARVGAVAARAPECRRDGQLHELVHQQPHLAGGEAVRSQTTLDLRFSYELDGLWDAAALRDTIVAFGITNVFDRDPPFVNLAPSPNGGGGFDPSLGSPLGRVMSLSVSKRF
ncbi:MAG: TonB-dependent receptor [Rubrivivax sp.]|nr:TonB-dependent receptor [Rubrivivax sp.]